MYGRRDQGLDQEDRANAAKGAMTALEDLISGQDQLSSINPRTFYYLIHCVFNTCRDAIPDGHPCRRPVNDIDGEE
ncbi:hypothetical protein [Sphingomonas sanguinis]|uniref:hypothetical protein n=1 Tax=Sphingomonas sanguinis TaxID=33051 RepID=UPI00301885CE